MRFVLLTLKLKVFLFFRNVKKRPNYSILDLELISIPGSIEKVHVMVSVSDHEAICVCVEI